MQHFWPLATIVFLFSTIQSLFGVGLLVFGTPTLLLLGDSFEETISVLLPSSLIISLMQVLNGRNRIGELRNQIIFYAVPFIVVGLVLVLSKIFAIDIKLFVGVALVCTAITRYHKKTQQALANFLQKHTKFYLMFTGLVHGFSNMGGGFLTILATSIYSDKETTRANIAFGYMLFALSQIIVLMFLHREAFGWHCLGLAALALLTYRTVGSLIYVKSSQNIYQHLITIFMAAYGIVLIGQKIFR